MNRLVTSHWTAIPHLSLVVFSFKMNVLPNYNLHIFFSPVFAVGTRSITDAIDVLLGVAIGTSKPDCNYLFPKLIKTTVNTEIAKCRTVKLTNWNLEDYVAWDVMWFAVANSTDRVSVHIIPHFCFYSDFINVSGWTSFYMTNPNREGDGERDREDNVLG